MPEMVCCPVCWTWSPAGKRLVCKKCGADLLLTSGQSLAAVVAPPDQAALRDPAAPPPAPLPPLDTDAGTQVDPAASGPNPVRRRHRLLRPVAATGVAVVVAGVVAGGILGFRFLHGSADMLVNDAPSDSIAYVNVNLDPPGGQKLAIASLLGKFPGLSDASRDATVDTWLDTALTGSGLNHTDIRSWLGSELSVVVLPGDASGTTSAPAVVLIAASTNDSAARAMFDRIRSSTVGAGLAWTTRTHDGVDVSSSSGGQKLVYAVDSGDVLIGDDVSRVDEVIDTAHGTHATIQSTGDYTTVQAQLPGDRIASMYLDAPALVRALKTGLNAAGTGAVQTLSALNAYRGIGAAVVASPDGVTIDATQDYDTAQLSADQRAMITIPSHVNGSIAFVPPTAFGFVALAGVPDELRALLNTQCTCAAHVLEQLGITGASGIISHLTGDAGFEVDAQPGSKVPAGALLFQVDSASAAQAFLGSLAGRACGLVGGSCDLSHQTAQTYQGVAITSIGVTGTALSGVNPSFAVSGNWAIIASSADEIKAMLDAQHGASVTAAPRFSSVAGQIGTSNVSMFYVDVQSIVAAVRAALPPSGAAAFDQNVAPYLSHFEAFGGSSQNAGDHTTSTLFLLIS